MDWERIRIFIQKRPMVVYPVLGLAVWGICGAFMMPSAGEHKTPVVFEKNSNIGLSVGGVDQQAYLARIEKNYYDFEERVRSVEEQMKGMKSIAAELKKQQKEISKTVLKLDEKLISKMEERFDEIKQSNGVALSGDKLLELAIADIKPAQKDADNSVYLPIGSFCKGTLLTGVYAAADVNNPLPVLIALDEAFYGPNKTRIPLKGSFVLGKAYGDLVSQRVLIQIVAISLVLPDGHAFEREENLGYVTDEAGELGIRGQIVRNTGKELAMSFMGGFTSGGAQAIADNEVTVRRDQGGISRDVTGNAVKNSVFSGLAKSAGRMSEYYERQAENLVPAVRIGNGATVYFIVQKGVDINGLSRMDYADVPGIK